MTHIPFHVHLVFVATALTAIFVFYWSSKSRAFLTIIMLWLVIQTLMSLTGYFTITDTIPPRLIILVMPPLLVTVALFTTTKGRAFIDRMDLKTLTLLHALRLPVETVLFWLFIHKAMPELMTFRGRNLDIISGITAPLVYYFGYVKPVLGPKFMLAWNIICLSILLFTVGNGVLSAPGPFQQFAFEQPNIAVLYFPFVWLPGIVVPLVYIAHLASIRRLLQQIKINNKH